MPTTLEDLLTPTSTDSGVWRSRHFDLSDPGQRERLEGLFAEGSVTSVHDTIESQLRELATARARGKVLAPTEARAKGRALAGGVPLHVYGRWIWYPWSGRLVHVLPPAEFAELRTNRNQYKITPEEQRRLRAARIGIVGLSVGQATAVTMALEGVGGTFRIADFDRLSLSNMNRLRAGVQDLGLNKSVIAARQMLEIDPYLELEAHVDGLTERSVDDFLGGGEPLDLLVEECDDHFMKLRLRERARDLGIPVIMDTNERGLLDVERFDLEPDRPILHGMLEGLEAKDMRFRPLPELLPIILRMVDGMNASPRALASVMEIGHTISNFPQLASAVSLGGALTTDVARRILLGTMTTSGRFHVDLEQLVRDGTAEPVVMEPPLQVAPAPTAVGERPPVPRPAPGTGAVMERDEVEFMVRHALLAPSGGNAQPWHFEWTGSALHCLLDAEASLMDYEDCGALVSLGTAVYNVELAAGELEVAAAVELAVEAGQAACIVRFSRGDGQPSPLFRQIPLRATNRKPGRRAPLSLEDQTALHAAADEEGAQLQILQSADALEEMGRLIGAGDRMRLLSEPLHREMMREMRWTPDEVEETRDGLDLALLHLNPGEAAVLRLMAKWPVMEELRRIGGGGGLERRARKLLEGASAVGLLTVPGTSRASYLGGGRPLQRVWLTATARGLSLQPQATLPYMFVRLERGGGEGLEPRDRDTLRALRGRWRELFDVREDRAEILLFAISRSGPPAARSLRRDLADVMTWREAAAPTAGGMADVVTP